MKSLAEDLGVIDPRPAEKRPTDDFDQLIDITDAKEFCRRVLSSREFRQYILSGIVLNDLPPAVITRIMDHGWGKPIERLEVKDTTDEYEDLTPEQLEARAMKLAQMARSARLPPMKPTKDNKESVH